MSIALTIRGGARNRVEQTFEKSVITIGRHPLSDLRFDVGRDLEVSSRHAEIRKDNSRYILVDSGSTNGTFLNGRRVDLPAQLHSGDTVTLGNSGPRIIVRIRPTHPTAAVRRSTTQRIALAVREHTAGLRRIVALLVMALIAAAGSAYWLGTRDTGQRRQQLDALLQRSDSISAAFERDMAAMEGQLAGLDSMLAAARRENDALRERLQLERGRADPRDVEELSSAVHRAELRRLALLSASQVDYPAINVLNSPAVVLIAVQMPDGRAYTGTGFNVGRRGLIVTNRHILQDDQGLPALRAAVIFADAGTWLPARILHVMDDSDLALLSIEADGNYPVIPAASEVRGRLRVGSPVAIIGYPHGVETPMERSGTRITARTTLGVGTVSKLLDEVVQIDAYAGQGSSGSPVFDREGKLVAIVFGGARQSGGRIVYAVPAEKLHALLPADITTRLF